MDYALKLSKNIRDLLIELFKSMLEMGQALIDVSKGVLMGVNNDWKEYKFGAFANLVSITNQSVSNFVSFFEEYIKGIKQGFDLVYELLKSLGVENYKDVLRRKVDLRSIVKPTKIDVGLLKFQLKTVLEYMLPKLEEHSLLVYRKSKELYDSAKIIESEVIQNFKTSVENFTSDWMGFLKKLYSTSELIFKEEDPAKCVDLLIQFIETTLDFAIRIWQTTTFTPFFAKDWIDYNIYEITQSAEIFSEIKRDIEIVTQFREKVFEHEANCFIVILRTLWGSPEAAREKLAKIIRKFLPDEERAEEVKELIPQKIPVEDLPFALVLARSEFDLSKSAAKRVKEKLESLRLAGEWLKSPTIYCLYETTIKRLEVKEKYDEKILEILIELQRLTEKGESKN